MYISPTVGYFVHQNFRPMARSPNTPCHNKPVNSSCNHHWLKPDSFESLWLIRLARTGGRKLIGDTLDGLLPWPNKQAVIERFRAKAEYLDKNTLFYSDIINGTKPSFKKLFYNRRLYDAYLTLHQGHVWGFLIRHGIILASIIDATKYLWLAYKNPTDRDKNTALFYRQALKWTIGSEIASLGMSIGVMLTKGRDTKMTTGFLMGALFAATFDHYLNKFFKHLTRDEA
jgi:hypothetical protein